MEMNSANGTTSMSSALFSLSLSMFEVAQAFASHIHDCIALILCQGSGHL